MAEKEDQIGLRLSRAEVLAFLVLVGRRTLPGLPDNFADISDVVHRPEFVSLLNQGYSSLNERGLLRLTDEEAPHSIVHDHLLMTLGQVLVCKRCVSVVGFIPGEGSRARFFCMGPVSTVTYTTEDHEQFLFEVIADHQEVQARLHQAIAEVLGETARPPAAPIEPVTFSVEALAAVIFVQRAWNEPDAAHEALVGRGCPPDVAGRLVGAFRQAPSLLLASATFDVDNRGDGGPKGEEKAGRALLLVPEGAGWWGALAGREPDTVTLTFDAPARWQATVERFLW